MKIAIFSDNFYPEISGISDSVIKLGQELAKRGHKIAFFAPKYTKKEFEIAGHEFKELDLGENVEFYRFFSLPFPGSPTKQSRIVIPNLWRWLKVKKFKPDIIYTQDIFGVGFEALIAAKILKIPLVGTNHTPITEFLKYGPVHGKWVDKICLKYVSWYYNRCKIVSAPNAGILEEMKNYGFKRPSFVISNPIDLVDFKCYAKDEKANLKKELCHAEHTVIYTGRLAPEKRIEIAIQAIAEVKKKFPDVYLVLTGYGNSEDSLKKLVKELKLENNVKFFGFVECGEKYTNLYNACDVFVVTSTAEMQCMGMMQAMACGLPVIAVKARALPEYVNEKNGYLIDIDDHEALAEKLVYLFENKDKIDELGRGALEYVQKFSTQSVVDEWEKVFESLRNYKTSAKIQKYKK